MAEEQKAECIKIVLDAEGKEERVSHGKHHFEWVWVNGVMTDTVRCMNCGAEKEYRTLFSAK